MKNRLLTLGTIIIMTAVIFGFTGCSGLSTPLTSQLHYQNWGVFGEAALLPIKDFESVGLVFTETTFIAKDDGQIEGTTFTHQALLKEAQKLGADAIINVTIDRRMDRITEGTGLRAKVNIQETWYGSALAIKYTNAVLPPHENTNVQVNARRTFDTRGRAVTVVE